MLLLACIPARGASAEGELGFNRDVRPILAEHCFQCHGPDPAKREADLRLDTPDGAMRDLGGYVAVVPGDPAKSELMVRIRSTDRDEVMPPPKHPRKLTQRDAHVLEQWIAQGAKYEPHWAFVPPHRAARPPVKQSAWPRNEIDPFILARLEKEGLAPSPEADKATLLRRVSLDLTGLPPTPEELDAFQNDAAPDAYENVVDRLLASPRYGERLVWDWLDAARYADTNGFQGDNTRTMWPWRDWVVRALNANMPFDEFTLWQLAGDLLPAATQEQKLATAFNRNHAINGEGGRIAEENRIEYLVDQTDTASTVWLGMTMSCARCHDHKYDPITQREFFQLAAFFNNTPVTGGGGGGQMPPLLDLSTPEHMARLAELDEKLKPLSEEVEKAELEFFPREPGKSAHESAQAAGLPGNIIESILKRTPKDRALDRLVEAIAFFGPRNAVYVAVLVRLKDAIEERKDFADSIPRVMIMQERREPEPRPTFILARGAYDRPADKVAPGFPAVLGAAPASGAALTRLDFARWLVSPEHPLTARVTVNRYWQAFFGVGLVKTSENFGAQGEWPLHQALLDWLAREFIESGWDVKAMHRRIVTSATYRQSSRVAPALLERDPENRLLARGPRFRLPSWMLRDQALAMSGLLVERVGGAPVKPYQPPGIWEEATFGVIRYRQDSGPSLYRRSLYTFWRRIVGPTMLFDTVSRQACAVNAPRTNTPLHALTTLNDITYTEASRAFAQRVLSSGAKDDAARLDAACRLVIARRPTDEEGGILLASLGAIRAHFQQHTDDAFALLKVGDSPRDEALPAVEHAAWASLCTLLLNLDETLTKE